MELTVVPRKKKAVTKAVIRNTAALRRIRRISWWLLAAGVFFGLLDIVCGVLIPDAHVVNINGVPVKDVGGMVSGAVLILVLFSFFALCAHMFLFNLSGRDIRERENERLVMTEEELRCSFVIRVMLIWKKQIYVTIPLAAVDSIEYDAAVKKLTLLGRFYCVQGDVQGTTMQNPISEEMEKMVLYDYFSPSLYENLSSKKTILDREAK